MSLAKDVQGTVFNNGSAVLMARVVNSTAQPITRAEVGTVTYSVLEVPGNGIGQPTAVPGHDAVSLDVVGTVFDTPQDDDAWTIDSTGYNFRHEIDVTSAPAFPNPGVCYLVRYEIQPIDGQKIVCRFRLRSL